MDEDQFICSVGVHPVTLGIMDMAECAPNSLGS
jgi:hypothetical protein